MYKKDGGQIVRAQKGVYLHGGEGRDIIILWPNGPEWGGVIVFRNSRAGNIWLTIKFLPLIFWSKIQVTMEEVTRAIL